MFSRLENKDSKRDRTGPVRLRFSGKPSKAKQELWEPHRPLLDITPINSSEYEPVLKRKRPQAVSRIYDDIFFYRFEPLAYSTPKSRRRVFDLADVSSIDIAYIGMKRKEQEEEEDNNISGVGPLPNFVLSP